MSFAAAFYNFTVELSHNDRDVFTRFRVKTPLHPLEPLEHLYARMIAYVHGYREGQGFSHGLFEPKEPTIWQKDILGDTLLWVQIGVPDKKKIEHTLRTHPKAEHRVYFYEPSQTAQFCHMLRGSKTNWIQDVQFFAIRGDILEALVPLERSSPMWNVTIVDDELYLTCDGVELQTHVETIDIWRAYQESLLEEPVIDTSSQQDLKQPRGM
jgi:uncharacterized protein YaeQ